MTSAPPTPSLKILVAEDNIVNQEVTIGILESLHCDVTVVDNGTKALRAYQTAKPGQFDVILMDCQMPVMDGFEAARRIRALECESRHIPIIALTANTFENVSATCLEAGMDDMLSKPFRRQALKVLLDQWCPESGATGLIDPGSGEASPGSVLDQETLRSLQELDADGSKRFLHRTIIKFASYGDDLIANMTTSATNNDMPEVSRLAHSLKSSSANLGATELANQCQEIEAITRDMATLVDISPHMEALTKSYRTAKQELLSLVES